MFSVLIYNQSLQNFGGSNETHSFIRNIMEFKFVFLEDLKKGICLYKKILIKYLEIILI